MTTTTLNYSDAAKIAMGAYLAALRAHRQQAGKAGADDRLALLDDLADATLTQLLSDNPELAGELSDAAPTVLPLRCTQHAADKVLRYIELHRKLRLDRAYGEHRRALELDTAAAAALHAILQCNAQTGFAAMILECNALERAA